jgi:Protein of unknown function (DUF1203)
LAGAGQAGTGGIAGDGVEEAIGRLLGLSEVQYVNVRNTQAGCFVARIEPVPA